MSNQQTADADDQQPEERKMNAEDIQRQCDEHLAGWKRALADYDNLKKEVAKEKVEFAKYATANFIRELLPALDYFDAALQHVPDLSGLEEGKRKAVESWKVGVEQVRKMLWSLLESYGVSQVPTEGMLDTSMHEAVEERESDVPPGTILSVAMSGYKIYDRLLRPAKVITSRGPSA